MSIRITCTNNGRSPARRVFLRAVAEIVPAGKSPNLLKVKQTLAPNAAIPNDGELFATLKGMTAFGRDITVQRLTSELVQSFASGRNRLFFFGDIKFDDVAGSHWQTFAFYFLPDHGWTRFEAGNDSGDGPSPWEDSAAR